MPRRYDTTKKRAPVGTKRRSTLDPREVADKIGVPLESWPGRCHEIAGLLLATDWVSGVLRYGMWVGPIDMNAKYFGGRGPITHHGWIEREPAKLCQCGSAFDIQEPCCKENSATPAVVIDPTRWVFENVQPYIFEGHDPEGYYDLAGDRLRRALLAPYPTNPARWHTKESAKIVALTGTEEELRYLRAVIVEHGGPNLITRGCAHSHRRLELPLRGAAWLANLPLSILGTHARALYEMLDKADLSGFVPQDNREVVMGDGFYGQKDAVKAKLRRKTRDDERKARK